MSNQYDIIFVGGGLASGLAAYRFLQRNPQRRALIVEQASTLGGNHTWSFHGSDLTRAQFKWVEPFISKGWSGYEVRFPALTRYIRYSYHSITSAQFHRILTQQDRLHTIFGQKVAHLGPHGINLQNGDFYQARCVVDGRGWNQAPQTAFAYQKFVGMDLKLKKPHFQSHPLLMDAQVRQKDGFRFFYVLPWSDHELLVEDTRYSLFPDVDPTGYQDEIKHYVESRFGEIAEVKRIESGSLPIPMNSYQIPRQASVPLIGMRAGFFHATTGYSLPLAVRFADALSHFPHPTSAELFESCEYFIERHQVQSRFYRLLNRMMFRAAVPTERFKILEKFYQLPEDVIARFYSGHLTKLDTLKILSGRPPVPVFKALRSAFQKVQ